MAMVLHLVPLVASVNAALLAAAIGLRAWRRGARGGLYAAGLLGAAGAAVSLVALGRADPSLTTPVYYAAEGALTLVAGPLLVLFVTSVLGLKQPLAPMLFAPLAVFLVAAVAQPDCAAGNFVVERLVLVQMAFSTYAAWRVLRFAPVGARQTKAWRIAAATIAAMAALHAAQIARMFWPHSAAITDIVPLVGAAALLALTAATYFGGRITALNSLLETPAPAGEDARALVAALECALEAGLLRDPELTLAHAATAIEARPETLGRALAAVTGLRFVEYLQRKRVDAARRLLTDPREARTSVEAVGLLAGFGSRSAFYKSFGDLVGVSPAKYRASGADFVQKADSGQETPARGAF